MHTISSTALVEAGGQNHVGFNLEFDCPYVGSPLLRIQYDFVPTVSAWLNCDDDSSSTGVIACTFRVCCCRKQFAQHIVDDDAKAQQEVLSTADLKEENLCEELPRTRNRKPR